MMTTTEILTGIKSWVTGKLNLKQDVISDLASIRQGAQAGATSVQPSDLIAYFNDARYNTSTHRINFYHGQNVVAYIDASPFIVDGMVDDVRIENGYLVVDFNTASGKQDISIPLTDIFNPNNYYTKGETDSHLTQKQSEIDDLYARIGYYVCSTEGNVAAKTIVANNYTLGNGGSIKVKMNNANTANNATLNINSTGAKALYYVGERASSTNTWEAGETIEVYYDGTSYYANNVAGGANVIENSEMDDVLQDDTTYLLDGLGNVVNDVNDEPIQTSRLELTVDELNTVLTDTIPDIVNELSDKEDKLTFDSVPTKGSTNPVTSDGVAKAIEASQVLPHEYVTVTATANKGDISSAVVTIYDENDEELATGEGSVSLSLEYGTVYKVGGARVYNYLTPTTQIFTAEQIMRDVTVAYTYIERDVVTLDQSISDAATMLSGDIQGDVIKQIRANSHLYLGTPTTQEGDTEGTESICQLDDTDSRKYFDGTTAALDGTEGDQWMKLPVFWWKIEGVGTADASGVHDKYSFSYAIAGEPDPTWNKWEGDRNLLAAKEMTVKNGVGHSISGGQSTGSFTHDTGNDYAAANNVGCQEVTWEWQWMMCMLFYAWHNNTNSQAVCGVGSNSYSRTLGVTDALGMTDTTSQQATSLTSARFWGLEAWWNCKSEWIGNVTMSDYVLNIIDMNTKQTRQVRGFVQCGGTGGWSSRMRIDANGDFVPVAKNATDATSYCDWVNSNSGSRVLVRSNSLANAYGGVAYVSAYNAPSYTNAGIGSRLAFNGNVIVIGSVAEYKALLS